MRNEFILIKPHSNTKHQNKIQKVFVGGRNETSRIRHQRISNTSNQNKNNRQITVT